jgi:hypothetical protein
MRIINIIKLLNGELLTQSSLDKEYTNAFSCDLMSDCLAFVNENCLLITGLTNIQSLRTAELLDIDCIIYVRGKKPNCEMITFANDNNIILISTCFTMYETSGVLYHAGIKSLKI